MFLAECLVLPESFCERESGGDRRPARWIESNPPRQLEQITLAKAEHRPNQETRVAAGRALKADDQHRGQPKKHV